MFHLHLSSDNQFYFTLRARNGRVLMTSETYKSKAMAKRGMIAVFKAKWVMNRISPKQVEVDHIDHTEKVIRNGSKFRSSGTLFTTERTVNGKLKVVRVGK